MLYNVCMIMCCWCPCIDLILDSNVYLSVYYIFIKVFLR